MINICTFTGKLIDLENPRPEDIDIRDVAHHLALIPRWGGAVREFYSVAQHSVLVAEELMRRMAWETPAQVGLLHDAHEAYAFDLIDPLAELVGPRYREVEKLIGAAISSRFGLSSSTVELAEAAPIREADLRVRAAEARDLIEWQPPEEWWARLPVPRADRIKPLTWRAAEEQFLMVAAEIGLWSWSEVA
jgi:5'-deoxynucleotidase YfbR-like HD superfamily hydrolase